MNLFRELYGCSVICLNPCLHTVSSLFFHIHMVQSVAGIRHCGSSKQTQGGCGGCGGGCASGGCAGCSGCGGGAEREPYVETRTFTDIVTLTRENFQTEVLDDPGLILIDFWAEWCQPCRMLAPAFEELNREEPQVKFCRVNVDEQGELAQMFGIESIPTLAVVQDRHTLTGSVGLRSKEEIKAMLDGCK